MRYPVVIFDVDGTLVDSNAAHASAWAETFAAFGHTVPLETIRRLIGKGGDKLLKELTNIERESEEGRAMADHRRELFLRNYLPSLQSTPGAAELLKRLRSDGRTIVIASSAEASELGSILGIVDGTELIQKRTSSDDAERSKPDPDIVAAALNQSGHPRENAIMIGDTPYDVEAASRCGIPTIGLLSGGWSAEALANAVAVFEHPADLLARFDESPLAQLR